MASPNNTAQADGAGLEELFDRVNQLLGEPSSTEDMHASNHSTDSDSGMGGFTPRQPRTLQESGVSELLLEKLILKFCFQIGIAAAPSVGWN